MPAYVYLTEALTLTYGKEACTEYDEYNNQEATAGLCVVGIQYCKGSVS